MTLYGRRAGKTTRTIAAIRDALARGRHVHVASRQGAPWCVEGPADCPAVHRTLAEAERELRK